MVVVALAARQWAQPVVRAAIRVGEQAVAEGQDRGAGAEAAERRVEHGELPARAAEKDWRLHLGSTARRRAKSAAVV
jgi:hypothetical protein